ncbi:transmembrane alpha-helix domain-containing protein [Ophiocordyceps camponoti-floridani]|uniref:Transmembrane alpha-helix domain-containing protein n=1 Tax=Ophiocordyceps camponoti-floridani TaxID=2030778 RepID=A0A8H4QB54_9HYPO|nr:transmembrane alpha-helix domain-containing protein [Ophiocordyceps camponoti-floridani]
MARSTTWSAPDPPTTTRPALSKRRDAGTVCGFIGGDAAFPATCIAGSHCAVDVAHGVVGCCPDDGPCATGVFTGCVDAHSGPQSVSDPYVFTCSDGGDVCYRNLFEGGFYQFGCGAGSHLATSVATSPPDGMAGLAIARVTLAMTESVRAFATPVEVGGFVTPSFATTTTMTTMTTSTMDSETTSLARAADNPTSRLAFGPVSAPPRESSTPPSGAVIGGIIGGVFGLGLLLAAIIFVCCRRRRRSMERVDSNKDTSHNDSNNNNNNNDDDDLTQDDDMDNTYEHKPLTHDASRPPHALFPDTDNFTGRGTGANKGGVVVTAGGGTILQAVNGGGDDPGPHPLVVDGSAWDSPRPAPPLPDETIEMESSAAYPGLRRKGGGALWQQNRWI